MKKKLLIGFVGLYRTFEKTFENIFSKFICPNMDEFDISIIINTDYNCTATSSWVQRGGEIDQYYKYNDHEVIENKLKMAYGKYGQLKEIIWYSYKEKKIGTLDPYAMRISQILKNEEKNNNKYDYYAFLRMDIIISKPIIIKNILKENSMICIAGSKYRKCHTFNRDWDFMHIGDYKSIMTFIYPLTTYPSHQTCKQFIYKSNDSDFENIYAEYDKIVNLELTPEQIEYIKTNGGLDGDTSCLDYYKIVYMVLLNKCKFLYSENYGILAMLIR
jgi:hypothetical protein